MVQAGLANKLVSHGFGGFGGADKVIHKHGANCWSLLGGGGAAFGDVLSGGTSGARRVSLRRMRRRACREQRSIAAATV